MAVRKKYSRRIVVDGIAYQWRFPRRMTNNEEDGWPGVAVTANRENDRRAVLIIVFPDRFHLSGPVRQDPPRPVLPSDVARGIREAVAAGWNPDKPCPQFIQRVHDAST